MESGVTCHVRPASWMPASVNHVSRAVKPGHSAAGPCSTSSLESCGVLSGPIASSGPSQFPSPSQVLGSTRQEPYVGQSGSLPATAPSTGQLNPTRAFSSAHDDVGFMRIPVTNQVCFLVPRAGEVAVVYRSQTRVESSCPVQEWTSLHTSKGGDNRLATGRLQSHVLLFAREWLSHRSQCKHQVFANTGHQCLELGDLHLPNCDPLFYRICDHV